VARIADRTKPLAPRPRRVFVFAKAAPGTDARDYLPVIEEACASRNIDVVSMGRLIGRTVADPLQVMGEYDLVVGSARPALEGAACGAAVIVADGRGLAGMLTASNFERFRANNFGRELLVRPVTAELIGQEIDRYDPVDARKVSNMVLASASLDRQLDEIETIFVEAIDLLAQMELDDDTSHRALSSYLASHLPRCAEGEASPRHRQITTPSVDARLKSLERGISEVTSHSADFERRLGPLFAIADSINRNRAAINLLRPFAKVLRAMTRKRPHL